MEIEKLQEIYPLHYAVFNNDPALLEQLLLNDDDNKEKINTLDTHGRSPVMLAAMLKHIKCAEILLERGADANTHNNGKWGLSHEAVLHKNPEFIKKVLMYRDFARAKNMVKTLKNLASSLVDQSDYSLKIRWELSSWLPFSSHLLPSDSYKIYKRANAIRIDGSSTTKPDEQDATQDSFQSILFRYDSENQLEILVINRKTREAFSTSINLSENLLTLEDYIPSDSVIAEKLRTPITTTYIETRGSNFEPQKPTVITKFLSMLGSEEKVAIDGFTCKAYRASDLEIVSKKCQVHLDNEDGRKSDADAGGFFTKLAMDTFTTTATVEDVGYGDAKQNDDVYRGLTADAYFSSRTDHETLPNIGLKRKEYHRTKSLDANFWIADDFPLDFRQQIFPILDLLSARESKFQQLKPFIDLQLPIGFPIKVKIPLFQLANAQITFHLLNDVPDSSDSFQFEVPANFSLIKMEPSIFFSQLGFLYADSETEQEISANELVLDYESFCDANSSCDNYDLFVDADSSFKSDVERAKLESILAYSNSKEVTDNQFDSDMTKALELSLLEQQNRNEILNQEDDEFNRILEISTIEK